MPHSAHAAVHLCTTQVLCAMSPWISKDGVVFMLGEVHGELETECGVIGNPVGTSTGGDATGDAPVDPVVELHCECLVSRGAEVELCLSLHNQLEETCPR